MSDLVRIALAFGRIGLLAFGGSTAVLPELERQVVSHLRWLTEREFVDSYALGQVTPGPALLMVMFIGYRIAGAAGAVTALAAITMPSLLASTFVVARWDGLRQSPWLNALRRSFAAIALGLTLAGAYTIIRTAVGDVLSASIAAITFAVLWRWRFPPALVLVAGALIAVIFAMAVLVRI